MKKSATFLGAAAVAAMIAAPVAAAERFSAPVAGESELGAGEDNGWVIVAAIGLATIAAGVIIFADALDDDDAVSP